MLRSDKISRMELKVLFSEDPALVIRRADKFLSSEPVLHNLILSAWSFSHLWNIQRP
jgi:hypothetical protein